MSAAALQLFSAMPGAVFNGWTGQRMICTITLIEIQNTQIQRTQIQVKNLPTSDIQQWSYNVMFAAKWVNRAAGTDLHNHFEKRRKPLQLLFIPYTMIQYSDCWMVGAIHMGVVFIQNVFVTGPFPLVWVSGPCEGWPTQFWYITLHFVDFGKNLLTFALGVSSSSSSREVGANKYNGRMGSADAHGWREWDGSGMEDFCLALTFLSPPFAIL